MLNYYRTDRSSYDKQNEVEYLKVFVGECLDVGQSHFDFVFHNFFSFKIKISWNSTNKKAVTPKWNNCFFVYNLYKNYIMFFKKEKKPQMNVAFVIKY